MYLVSSTENTDEYEYSIGDKDMKVKHGKSKVNHQRCIDY